MVQDVAHPFFYGEISPLGDRKKGGCHLYRGLLWKKSPKVAIFQAKKRVEIALFRP
jgi:hypothetical protein